MQELPPGVPAAWEAGTGVPRTVSVPEKLLWTSTPTVPPPGVADPAAAVARAEVSFGGGGVELVMRRDDVPMPALKPRAAVPVPAPTQPSAGRAEEAVSRA